MIHPFEMPVLSSTMTEGKVVAWLKQVGDYVKANENIVVVESDKSDMESECFHDGYIATILVATGGKAPTGQVIALIAETVEEMQQVQQNPEKYLGNLVPAAQVPSTPVSPEPELVSATPVHNGRVMASPRAKKLAQQHHLDLAQIKGSGPYGRIVAEDVLQIAAPPSRSAPITPVVVAVPPATLPTPQPAIALGSGTITPLNTLQQAVVRNMLVSLTVPVFRVTYGITTNALDTLYQQIKAKGVTMTALFAKAIALTLTKHPLINSRYTDQGVQQPEGIHVAVAVAMDDGGLLTPVLAHADQQDIYTLSRSWQDLVKRARNKQLQPQEYNSGTFTLSNLGMFGVEQFDAILPPNQGAILAVGASQPEVVALPDGCMAVRRRMRVTLTCDHRVIYGAHAAAFLQDLAKRMETETQSLVL
ncbi:branched-chain alpha-keto acid dehydrogenase subunit E2 [Gloeomargarita lithophora Alchichica-D10]|uniref:Dihydrolipoamide acetyltransferase component of pyruvate dehydrogenase complex n=1 Tax=Gloeomargarita lithophora Alchichica-D10 TaxID=1188229 RepID=A0A1J0AGI2_9CYAN|nr:dihydrolipoamide acetyltransferase family protein [Gloeomargarita lithophora]APB35008.1 branched-chain alpha-keto acid dehydrogenase subunit E2 [Gloeomargarita lithophora Alchichica-D10]